MISEHATSELDADGVATVTIKNAKALNIVNTAVIKAVTAAVAELADRPEVRVLVLRGTGERAFIGGADINEMAALDRRSAEVFINGLRGMCEVVRSFPAPVVARIPGWCLGGGLEVAVACDLRICGSDARFGMPEVAVGIPSVIHAALLPRLIGTGRASWLMLTGEHIDAATALSWGLVHEVCEPADLDDAVTRAARRFVEYGPAVVRQQKKLLRSWEDLPIDQAIADSVAEFGAAFDTGEPQRFMADFLNRKR
ncbi:enoyl-CoA hydratase [Saccharopolyspora sp. K220]|uniref:enoyl-CoA hydratase n=1 Tax=Saccharopolyspora soli TaxID=2926618 RepID=UPI001F57582A|nr:enoyl-CoA hydratase [Saccharopolyspora soli]MCI2422991.1 enoyl-CoA hydratase [Saccharopolyspora soli]